MAGEATGTAGSTADLDRANIEILAFTTEGRRDLGEDLWVAANRAAMRLRRECWRGLTALYGARNPHTGWIMFVLVGAALCAAVGAALSPGLRYSPADTTPVVLVLALIAGLGECAALLGCGGRALSRVYFRPQLVVTIGLCVAASVRVARGWTVPTLILVGCAVVGIVTFAVFILVRVRRPDEAAEMDVAIAVAVAGMAHRAAETAEELQRGILASLDEDEQERIAGVRDATLLDRGMAVSEGVPAGGLIIAAQIARWLPSAFRA